MMQSKIVKRSIKISGHKTSVSLEDAFWNGLKAIAHGRKTNLSDLISFIDNQRKHANLSSAIRLFVLDFYLLNTATPERNVRLDVRNGQPSLLRAG
jgi:predicted DNA-binding ribbon-helix-helix protein